MSHHFLSWLDFLKGQFLANFTFLDLPSWSLCDVRAQGARSGESSLLVGAKKEGGSL